MSPLSSFNNDAISATADILNNEALACDDFLEHHPIALQSSHQSWPLEDEYVWFAFFNFFPPSQFREMFLSENSRVELAMEVKFYFNSTSELNPSYRPLLSVSDWLHNNFPKGSGTFKTISEWFVKNDVNKWLSLFSSEVNPSLPEERDVSFWQPLQSFVGDKIYFTYSIESSLVKKFQLLRSYITAYKHPEIIRNILFYPDSYTDLSPYLTFHEKVLNNEIINSRGFQKALIIPFRSNFDAALKVIEWTVKAYNIKLDEVKWVLEKMPNFVYALRNWDEEFVFKKVNFYRFAKLNYAKASPLSEIPDQMKNMGLDCSKVDWPALDEEDARAMLWNNDEKFVPMHLNTVVKCWGQYFNQSPCLPYTKTEEFKEFDAAQEEYSEIKAYDKSSTLTTSLSEIYSSSQKETKDVESDEQSAQKVSNTLKERNWAFKSQDTLAPASLKSQVINKIKNIDLLLKNMKVGNTFDEKSEEKTLVEQAQSEIEARELTFGLPWQSAKTSIKDYVHPELCEGYVEDNQYCSFYDITKGKKKTGIILGCQDRLYGSFIRDKKTEIAEVFDRSCWNAFWKGICIETFEPTPYERENAKTAWTVIHSICKNLNWYDEALNEALDQVLEMKKNNMWILKFLFKTGVRINKAVWEKEKMKTNRSEAFKKLLEKHLDFTPVPSHIEDDVKADESALKREGKTVVGEGEQSSRTPQFPVLVNIKWATGSFKCELGHGHTVLREQNGQYSLDVSL